MHDERPSEGRPVDEEPRGRPGDPRVAFVLGGGGVLGAHEVGMLRALEETGVRPDLVVGTSIGALNGVFVAAGPDTAVERLTSLWSDDSVRDVFGARVWARLWTLARSGTHLHSNEPLRRMLDELLPVRTFGELATPFQCVAAGIETAMAHWFTDGPLIPAVLASSAAPGLLPPVPIGDRHYFDGLDHLATVRDIWRRIPLTGVVHALWWRIPAEDVPRDREARTDWLYTQWERADAWITANSAPAPK